MVLGNAVLALRSFGRSPWSANVALRQMLIGMALKWLVFLVVVYVALARLALPPLPLLAGVAGTTLAFLYAGRLKV